MPPAFRPKSLLFDPTLQRELIFCFSVFPSIIPVLLFFDPTLQRELTFCFSTPPSFHSKKKQKTSGLQNGLQEPSFHDMTKVAYVLRFRHVEFITLQNQLIFYQKKCWLRSVVNAILQICQFYKAFLMKNPSKNDPPIPTTPRPNRQKWCTYCVFAMSASPRCGTSMFFHKK